MKAKREEDLDVFEEYVYRVKCDKCGGRMEFDEETYSTTYNLCDGCISEAKRE